MSDVVAFVYEINRKILCRQEDKPGPLNIALIVPDVKACSLFTMNSCLSDDINLTYIALGPSQPPYTDSPSTFSSLESDMLSVPHRIPKMDELRSLFAKSIMRTNFIQIKIKRLS